MEGRWTTLLSAIRAENCCTTFSTEIANIMLELIVGKVEVVKFARRIVFFLSLLHFLCPHGTVYMHELINLEWN